MCGEHSWSAMMAPFSMGSSPHVRGAQPIRDVFADIHGIIPACAGSTEIAGTAYMAGRDHPRMCGEHMSAKTSQWFVLGSSPHVRGAPVQHVDPDGIIGIIPACAGSTIKVEFHQSKGRDHPRMCGEHHGRRYR